LYLSTLGSRKLHVLDDAGHGGGDTFITAVVGALNRFAAT
jgi:hypothetical protein